MERLEGQTSEEDHAQTLAAFYNEGYDGHIPTYAEEQLAHLAQWKGQQPTQTEESAQDS